MPDYPHLYAMLFNEITDAIGRLQQAQREAERLYVAAGDEPLPRRTPLHLSAQEEARTLSADGAQGDQK